MYDSSYWDMLFPDAASVSKAAAAAAAATGSGGGGLTVEDVALLSTGNLLLEVPSRGGETEVLDVNHVWVGIEAVGAAPAGVLLQMLGVSSITGVSTWSGDLASAVAEKHGGGASNYGCTEEAAAAANTTVIECYLAALADHADLRSDVDGIALGAAIMAAERANTTAVPLSSHVETYYNATGGSMCRVTQAALALGWAWGGDGKFAAETVSAITASIAADADVLIKQSAGCPSNIGACLTAKCVGCDADVAAAVAYGVGWFESERQAELLRGCSGGSGAGDGGRGGGSDGGGDGSGGGADDPAASHGTSLLFRSPGTAFVSTAAAVLLAAIALVPP